MEGFGLALGHEGSKRPVPKPAEIGRVLRPGGCRLQVPRIVESQGALWQPGFLQRVDVPIQERKRYGPRVIRSTVLVRALDEDRNRHEARCGGLRKVARPLVDTDGTSHVFGSVHMVGLAFDNHRRKRCKARDEGE